MIRSIRNARAGHRRFVIRRVLHVVTGALCVAGCFHAGAGEESSGSSGVDSADLSSDSNGAPSCDPETFIANCVEGRVVECSADGFVELRGCGSRSRCEVGSDGPGCVWRVGESCDGEYEQCADPGGILACRDGFWQFEGCPIGGACSRGECFGPEATPCDWPNDEHYCEGDAVVSCFPHGFEVSAACETSEVCRPGVDGGVCVPRNAVSCDPDRFQSSCQDTQTVVYCGVTGWTEAHACSDGDRCFEGSGGAACEHEGSTACDSETHSATCEDGRGTWCSFSGIEMETQCGVDTECVIDETCVFGCQEMALCVPGDAEPCEEPVDSFCMGDLLSVCFGGHTLPGFECDCVEDDDGASCADASMSMPRGSAEQSFLATTKKEPVPRHVDLAAALPRR